MRVLITGVDGFVGRHAADFFARQPGVEVHGTVISKEILDTLSDLPPSVHLHPLDLLDSAKVIHTLTHVRPDRVLHLAAQAFVPASVHDPIRTFRTNTIGGVAILEAIRSLAAGGHPATTIIVSTGEVYGRVMESDLPISERTPLKPNNPYASSKAAIDIIAQQYRSGFALPVMVARPFNHTGPKQNPTFVCSDFAKQFAEIAAGKRESKMRVGNIETQRDFSDVRDVVRAYWMLFEQKTGGAVFNICSGKPVRIRSILDLLSEISGLKVDLEVEETRLRTYEISIIYGSNQELIAATGWKPEFSLRQTIRDLYDYWVAEIAAD